MVGISESGSLIAELSHEINSPLAAIRNALYLISCRTDDPRILDYLEMANQEVSSVAATLKRARVEAELVRKEQARVEHEVPRLRAAA